MTASSDRAAFARQREEDAAYFEDWSEWRHLALLGSFAGMIELRPLCATSTSMVRRLPEARPYQRHRYDEVRCYLVPVRHWRAVRAALPRIASVDRTYLESRRSAR